MKQMKSSDKAEPSGAKFAEGVYDQEEPVENIVEDDLLISNEDVDVITVDNEGSDGMITIKVPRELGTAIQAAVRRKRYFVTLSYVRSDKRVGTHCSTNNFPGEAFEGVIDQIKNFTVTEIREAGGVITPGQAAQEMRQSLKERRQRGTQRRRRRKGR